MRKIQKTCNTTLSLASHAVMIPLEAGITYVVHEAGNDVDQTLLKILAIGIIGIANMASVAVETKTLQKQGYSASPVGSMLNTLTGKPVIASVGEHITMLNYQ